MEAFYHELAITAFDFRKRKNSISKDPHFYVKNVNSWRRVNSSKMAQGYIDCSIHANANLLTDQTFQ